MTKRSMLMLAAALAAVPAAAQELRMQCYSDGNECEVTRRPRQALRGAEQPASR